MLRMVVLHVAATAVAVAGVAAYASDAQLATVIVMAEKRSESLQDVPAALSALTGAALEAMGAESLTDYARSIPGLTFKDAGAGRQSLTLRGINPSAGAAAVGYYIGEAPMPASPVVLNTVVNPALVDIVGRPTYSREGGGSALSAPFPACAAIVLDDLQCSILHKIREDG
jgi:outer membrane receptor protein involved in Fe transport